MQPQCRRHVAAAAGDGADDDRSASPVAGSPSPVAEQPHLRDLLGHLCAEIERQQVQIDEQGEEMAELAEENRRLRLELSVVRASLGGEEGPVGGEADCDWSSRRYISGVAQVPLIAPRSQDAESQTAQPAPPIQRCREQAKPVADCPRSETVDLQDRFAAAVRASTPVAPSVGDASHGSTVVDRSSSNADSTTIPVGQPSIADEEGPPWSLSPTSLASNASSPMWLGSASESFSSMVSPIGDGRRQAGSADSLGDQHTNWPGLRRHAPEAALASAVGSLTPRRLVRAVLDALDAAQRRLQQGAARHKAKRAAALNTGGTTGASGMPGGSQAQVDIRIYLPGATSDHGVSEDRARAKDDSDVSAGSFMYILL